jgi:hypothetical protein
MCLNVERPDPEVTVRILAAIIMLLPLSAVAAYAHGFLDHAEPCVGSTVQNVVVDAALGITTPATEQHMHG